VSSQRRDQDPQGRVTRDVADPLRRRSPVRRGSQWLWKVVDGAKNAGELCGRGLVVIAVEQCASRPVVPTSRRSHPTAWSSHKDHTAKALKKARGPHLPASLRQLETPSSARIANTWPRNAAPPPQSGVSALAAGENVEDDEAIDVERDVAAVDGRPRGRGGPRGRSGGLIRRQACGRWSPGADRPGGRLTPISGGCGSRQPVSGLHRA